MIIIEPVGSPNMFEIKAATTPKNAKITIGQGVTNSLQNFHGHICSEKFSNG